MKKVFRSFKKGISILIILTMIVSITPVFADAQATLRVSSASVYRNGTAKIKVTLENIDAIAGLQFYLNYDKNNFEVDQDSVIINPDLLQTLELQPKIAPGIINVVGAKSINIGVANPVEVLSFTIKAKANANYNTFDLTLSSPYVTISENGGSVKTWQPAVVNGSIRVIQPQGSTPTTPPTTAPTTSPSGQSSTVKMELKPSFSSGKASYSIPESEAKQAINNAIAAAKAKNTPSELQFNLSASSSAKSIEAVLNKNTVSLLKSNSVDYITFVSSLATLSLNEDAISAMATGYDATLTITLVDPSTLSEELQDKVKDSPVYEISLVSNGKKINDLGKGSVKVSVPYDATGKETDNIASYAISEDGSLTELTNASYNTTSKAVEFNTSKLGQFAFRYEVSITFNDVSGWSAEYIYFLAKKGIIKGKSEGIFAPNDNVTRAEFVAIIARTLGADETQVSSTQFTDVSSSDWFASSVAWASKEGIVAGYDDGSFGPNKQITREEMCTMIVRTLTSLGVTMDKGDLTFADANKTSAWAKDSVAALAKAGIISGKGDNLFAPQDFATRAETAKIVYGFYQLLGK